MDQVLHIIEASNAYQIRVRERNFALSFKQLKYTITMLYEKMRNIFSHYGMQHRYFEIFLVACYKTCYNMKLDTLSSPCRDMKFLFRQNLNAIKNLRLLLHFLDILKQNDPYYPGCITYTGFTERFYGMGYKTIEFNVCVHGDTVAHFMVTNTLRLFCHGFKLSHYIDPYVCVAIRLRRVILYTGENYKIQKPLYVQDSIDVEEKEIIHEVLTREVFNPLSLTQMAAEMVFNCEYDDLIKANKRDIPEILWHKIRCPYKQPTIHFGLM